MIKLLALTIGIFLLLTLSLAETLLSLLSCNILEDLLSPDASQFVLVSLDVRQS